MANSTAAALIVLIRNLLRADAGSDVPVVSNDFLLFAISDGNLKYANAFSPSGDAPIVFQREFGITLVADSALAVAATTASTTLALTSSSSFPSASAEVIWGTTGMPDVVNYTSNASPVQSGVTGIGFSHAINDVVQLLYALPSNFGNFREEPTYGDGVQLNGAPLTFIGGPPIPGTFTMYDDGTTKYLWLPRQQTGTASVWYDKVSTTIDTTDDIVDVPPVYQMFLVWHALGFCYVGREKDYNLRAAAVKEADMVLQNALQNRNIHKKIRPRPLPRPMPYRDFTTLNGQIIPL